MVGQVWRCVCSDAGVSLSAIMKDPSKLLEALPVLMNIHLQFDLATSVYLQPTVPAPTLHTADMFLCFLGVFFFWGGGWFLMFFKVSGQDFVPSCVPLEFLSFN